MKRFTPTSPTSHFVYSHFVYYHFIYCYYFSQSDQNKFLSVFFSKSPHCISYFISFSQKIIIYIKKMFSSKIFFLEKNISRRNGGRRNWKYTKWGDTYEAVFKRVRTPSPKYEQLFRPHDRSHQAVAPKFTVTKSNDAYLQHVL